LREGFGAVGAAREMAFHCEAQVELQFAVEEFLHALSGGNAIKIFLLTY
jgi:hypothetical protein